MFEVSLSGPPAHPAGVPVPVGVRVRNAGDRAAWLAGVLDGSEAGVRLPSYRPAVGLDGEVLAGRPAADDPLVAPLRRGDFRLLAPGETMDPAGAGYLPLVSFATFTPPRPGAYRFTLTLSTDGGRPEDWLGPLTREPDRAAVLELVRLVPRVTVTSPPLVVQVG